MTWAGAPHPSTMKLLKDGPPSCVASDRVRRKIVFTCPSPQSSGGSLMENVEQVAIRRDTFAALQQLAEQQHREPQEFVNEVLEQGLSIVRQRLFFEERLSALGCTEARSKMQ